MTINKARLQLAKLKVAISVFLSIVRTAPIAGRMLSPDDYPVLDGSCDPNAVASFVSRF